MKNAHSLIIVESPSKARTIQYFLRGEGYRVESCIGHIKDLPKRRLGIDIDAGFIPTYEIIKGKKKIISNLKKEAKNSSRVLLATDPDREGEIICSHLSEELEEINGKIFRILFHEITEASIKDAIKNPTEIDIGKVNAARARRILDRLVGYKVSPLLWRKVRKGLSAGRVQSVALKFVVEREREIEAFISEEYYLIVGKFSLKDGEFTPLEIPAKGGAVASGDLFLTGFIAHLSRIKGEKIKRLSKEDAYTKKEDIEKQTYIIKSVKKKEEKKSPLPPFITSSLQQEAHRFFRFSPKRTMAIAQSLYEGVDIENKRTGLITYMRTDSFRIASSAQKKAQDYIKDNFGKEYLPASPPTYKKRKGAQEAHEAIRPTYLEYSPDKIRSYLNPLQFKLYSLIYKRFLASQMVAARIEVTTVEVKGGDYVFTAEERKVKFLGYRIVFKGEDEEEKPTLPPLKEGEGVELVELKLEQKFTQAPPRYTEGTLIRKLEEEGIGRPSTYASIMNVIKDRDYVRTEKSELYPTDLGKVVTDLLVENLPSIFHPKFTSKMEEDLDGIEESKGDWQKVVKDFYEPFHVALDKASLSMRNVKKEREKVTEEKCPECEGQLIIKEGRYGEFLACSSFPKCRYTKRILKKMGMPCPEKDCQGEIIEIRNKKGRVFYGCTLYPNCKWRASTVPIKKQEVGSHTLSPEREARSEGS